MTPPLKHDYFIEDLGRPAGWFKTHRYRYSCLRCGWAFVVESRGRLRAVDGGGEPLSGLENIRRVQSFVVGPCEPAQTAGGSRRVKPARTRRPSSWRRSDGIVQLPAR